jgi:hypothetical protein
VAEDKMLSKWTAFLSMSMSIFIHRLVDAAAVCRQPLNKP